MGAEIAGPFGVRWVDIEEKEWNRSRAVHAD